MKVSRNTVKQYIDSDITLPPVDELVGRINAQLGGVEEVIDLEAKYKDAKIVKVVACEKHPDADRLNVCQIDDGSGEYVQVVCGAPNVHKDMWAVWLPPESIVPSTYGTDDEFILGARALRGVMSNGMLASARELGIGDDHDGIVEITDYDVPSGTKLEPGESFAKVFGLDDQIIDVENKMFTHRPDLFGQLGVAREISAILGGVTLETDGVQDTRFVNPEWYWGDLKFAAPDKRELEVFNEAGDEAPRFMTVVMDNVTVKPSPLWLQCELVRWGGKPINNVVDATNYIMFLTAQPTHAYDYDKLRGQTLGVRMAKPGETATLLNNKTYELDESDVVIADGEGVVGLAGIMGGGDSEVSDTTTTVALEVATFDMYAVRRSSMRHGLFTDALTRFNKGQSKLQNARVLARLMTLLSELAGAAQASNVYDARNFPVHTDMNSLYGALLINTKFITSRLGVRLSPAQIGNLLRRANFIVEAADDDETQLSVTAPFWRTDIQIAEDIVEEVGRLYGYDKLPRELPQRSIAPAPKNQRRLLKQELREALRRIGANEVLTYSFVHKNILQKVGQHPDQALKITNALSPDLQYYRLSVLPSLLDKVHANSKVGYDEFMMYEIGRGHEKSRRGEDGLPEAKDMLEAVYAVKQSQGSPFYYMRSAMDALARDLGLTVTYSACEGESNDPRLAPFDVTRTAVVHGHGGELLGWIGELRQEVVKAFKLPQVAALSLDITALLAARQTASSAYQPLSRFPSITQDISLVVDQHVSYGALMKTVEAAVDHATGRDEMVQITPLAIYQADDTSQKTITLRIKVTNYEKTLTEKRVTSLLGKVEAAAKKHHDAKRG